MKLNAAQSHTLARAEVRANRHREHRDAGHACPWCAAAFAELADLKRRLGLDDAPEAA
jgi:hypothetical protein